MTNSLIKAWVICWEYLPLGSPGNPGFGFTLSIGQTNGVRARNAGRFNTGIKITVPEIFFGSSVLPNRITASTAGYSPPCTPALTNNTGPGFAPATEITGRGSSFANAAPGNLTKCRCVVPAFS